MDGVVSVQGGTVSGGKSGMFHDCNVSVSVRRDVWRLGARDLSTFGSSVSGVEREEAGKAGGCLGVEMCGRLRGWEVWAML